MTVWWVTQSVGKGTAVSSCMFNSNVFHAYYESVPLKDRAKQFYCATLGVKWLNSNKILIFITGIND